MNTQNKSVTLEEVLEQGDKSKTIQASEEIMGSDIPIHTLISKLPARKRTGVITG